MDAETAVQSIGKDVTTVMVRNVPSRYTSEELVMEFVNEGFENFDYFYLPIDFNSKRNRGYAFINFHSPIFTQQFTLAFHGRKLTRYRTKKVLEITTAVTQGVEENTAKALSKAGVRVTNEWFRPMVFKSEDFE